MIFIDRGNVAHPLFRALFLKGYTNIRIYYNSLWCPSVFGWYMESDQLDTFLGYTKRSAIKKVATLIDYSPFTKSKDDMFSESVERIRNQVMGFRGLCLVLMSDHKDKPEVVKELQEVVDAANIFLKSIEIVKD